MNEEQELEQCLKDKGLNAPRLNPDHIDSCIKNAQYHVFPGTTLTVCCLELKNGFTVTGESAAASPDNFNEEVGQNIAYKNARNKIWQLEGYLLREKLHQTSPENIARICHEINRAYCQALGDNSQPAWDDAPEWQRNSAMFGVELHLNNPDAGPEASHESWMRQKLADGWVYGEVKDPKAKTHPCLVPFDELPREQQAKDYLFRGVVHAVEAA